MLTVVVPAKDHYDEQKNEFFETKKQKLVLEHSLIALSKWESKWKKPFLYNGGNRTLEELTDYVRCMTTTSNVDPDIYRVMPDSIMKEIILYIDDPMTATVIVDQPGLSAPAGVKSSEIVTSELIYYWMVSFKIPFECQKWHLNRLLTLIKICGLKNAAQSGKKMSRAEILNRNRMINEQRKAELKSRG